MRLEIAGSVRSACALTITAPLRLKTEMARARSTPYTRDFKLTQVASLQVGRNKGTRSKREAIRTH